MLIQRLSKGRVMHHGVKSAIRENGPMTSILQSRWYLPTVLAGAFALRLCWMLIFHPTPVDDAGFFYDSAKFIADGHGYIDDGGFATAYFPIGYPLFLAMLFRVFGNSVLVAQTANLICSVVSLVLVYRIAKSFFKSEAAGRLSLFFLAIYPDNIAYTSLLTVETMYLFLLLLSVALVQGCILTKSAGQVLRLLIAGLVFGYATLVKVQTLLLPAFLFMLFPHFSGERRGLVHRSKSAAIVYVVLIGVLLPWVVRNHRLYHDIVLSNNGGLNLYIGNGPTATGGWVDIPWFTMRNDTLDEHEIDRVAGNEAIKYIETHPWHTLELVPKKLSGLFEPGDGIERNIYDTPSESKTAVPFLEWLYRVNVIYENQVYIFFAASVIFGCWKRMRFGKGHGWPLPGLVIILYLIGIYLVFYGMGRYHFPIVPWMIMYSAALFSSFSLKAEDNNSLNGKDIAGASMLH